MIYSFKDNLNAFVDGLLPALISILVVFVVLAIIMVIVMLLNKINGKEKKEVNNENVASLPTSSNVTKKVTMEDIKDEDMMVAVLVATIDYRNQVKEDVRLVNVKQIG